MSNNELARRMTIGELVGVYLETVAGVTTAIGMMNAAQKSLDNVFAGNSHVYVTTNGHSTIRFEQDKVLARLERDTWRAIVDRLDIWRIMSSASEKALKERIEKNQLPPLTEESAFELATSYMTRLDGLLNELAKEVFEYLRPHLGTTGAKYKRNGQVVVGKSVALPNILNKRYFEYHGRHSIDHSSQQEMRVLENVFRGMDGNRPTGNGYYSDLQNAINASADGVGRTEYFAFKAYKNGSVHITFLRDDLVVELNRRAGGMNLTKG